MPLKPLLFLAIFIGVKCCGDFYWRDYEGIIPADAIPAGRNANGFLYIGQGYIHHFGILMGTIVPGRKEIYIPCYGVKRTDVIIKILCAPDKRKFYWLPTTRSRYAADTSRKCPVLGGYDQKVQELTTIPLGTLHVGRTRKHGDAIIGNIAVYDPLQPWFYYPLNNSEIRTDEYEVLISNDYPIQTEEENKVAVC